MNKVTVIHQAFEKTPEMIAYVNVGDRTGDIALEYAYFRTQKSKARGVVTTLRTIRTTQKM